jgi:hypothetical protein
MPHRLKNNALRYLSATVNWEYLINADSSLTNELRLMLNLTYVY